LADATISNSSNFTIISPTDSNNNQDNINNAFENNDFVYLKPGIYKINGPIVMKEGQKLLGSPDAIIRVSSSSTQWFTGSVGIISCYNPKNIEIGGFEIDGNCDELPPEFNSNDQDPHDCERAIFLIGSTSDFGENVYIHDLKVHDTFSDGINIRCCQNVRVSNIEESNCEHEGIYFCLVRNGIIENVNIAGITSDCLRIENSEYILVDTGILYSYHGDDSNNAYQGGENGIQIGDQGVSFGVGSDKSGIIHTNNIEVRNITFANGRMSVWLDAAGKEPSDNVYIHDVKSLKNEDLERMGIPVNVDFSNSNFPTLEQSEKIFSSIFDILDTKFTDTGRTNQTADNIHYSIKKTENGIIAGGIKIIGFKDKVIIENETYIPDNNSVIVKTDAQKVGSFDFINYGINSIDKNVTVKVENGTATATLKVTTKYYKKTINNNVKLKKSVVYFNDSCPAPKILGRQKNATGIIYVYPTIFYVKVKDQNYTKIHYEYDGKSSDLIYMVGERHKDENRVEYTEFSSLKHWMGNFSTKEIS
jgi:hypothetical protein